jgi:hypothetical protein
MVQDKAPGSQSFPGATHISPQCELKNHPHRGRVLCSEVALGVVKRWNAANFKDLHRCHKGQRAARCTKVHEHSF